MGKHLIDVLDQVHPVIDAALVVFDSEEAVIVISRNPTVFANPARLGIVIAYGKNPMTTYKIAVDVRIDPSGSPPPVCHKITINVEAGDQRTFLAKPTLHQVM
jgi:hypothetical protein